MIYRTNQKLNLRNLFQRRIGTNNLKKKTLKRDKSCQQLTNHLTISYPINQV